MKNTVKENTDRSKKIRFGVLTVVILSLVSSLYFIMTNYPYKQRVLATWLWEAQTLDADNEKLLHFLKTEQVNTLYLQIDPHVPMSSYRKWIKQLTGQGVKVYALGGSPKWASSKKEDRVEAEQWLAWIKTYQYQAEPQEEAFSGIHLDVEPYLHEQWRDRQQELIENYQRLLSLVGREADDLRLDFGVDVPFWFDQVTYENSFGKGTLDEWVMGHCDVVTIMAYRNKADGQNGINTITRTTFELAKNHPQCRIIIAIETTKQPEVHISFWGQSSADMQLELTKVHKNYDKNVSLAGYAIHDLLGWMQINNGDMAGRAP